MSQAGFFSSSIVPPGSGIQTLTGNTGGPIGPDGGQNINILGGDGIEVTGAGNTLTVSSTGLFFNYINVNASPYFVLDSDVYLSVDSSVIPITILLPDNALLGEPFIIKDRTGNCAVNNINVTTVSGLTNIDGVTSFIMDSAYQSISIVGNGTTYEIY